MSFLMRKLLAQQGIYMNAASGEGSDAGGGAGGDSHGEGGAGEGQATGQEGGDAGQGEGGEGGQQGDGEGGEGAAGEGGENSADKSKSSSMTDADAKLLKENMKLKQRAKDIEDQLKQIKDSLGDIDPQTARKLAEDAKTRERAELEKKGEYERIVEQMRTENEKLVSLKDTELQTAQQQLAAAQAQIQDLTIGQNFRSAEFILEKSTLPPSIAQREFGSYFEFEDGQMVAYDKPRGAQDRTPLVGADGNPKPFNQAIEELYTKHPDAKSLIKASMKPGAGSRNQPDVKAGSKSDGGDARGLARIQSNLGQLSQ